MSGSFKIGNEYSFNIDELLQMGTVCKELRKEKDMLKDSQSKSTERIKRLETDVQSLSEARAADRKHIQELERELSNCSQEIEYLQDQLNLRNIEANCLGGHVHSLELKLVEAGKLHEKVSHLKEEVAKSNAERFFLMRELENREVELQNSSLFIEKLEETISSIALESECEIESMKLDIAALEHRSFEAKKFQEEAAQEKARMDGLIEGLEIRFQDAQKMVRCLERENKELREKLGASEGISGQRVEEHQGSNDQGLAVVAESDETLKDDMEKMSHQIHEYELLVKQLKDELREEKFKAKEEAEDLTQEMAELRYQITGMLEEECKRRACVEQVSLKRIAELESQVQKEQKKSLLATRHSREAQILAESRSLEVLHLKNVLKGLHANIKRNNGCSCGECIFSINLIEDCLEKEALEAEPSNLSSTDSNRISRASIAWNPEET